MSLDGSVMSDEEKSGNAAGDKVSAGGLSNLFSSKRERRLWLLTAIAMLAIYATLGPARIMVDFLRERNLLRVSVTLFILAIVAVLLWRWVSSRPGWSEWGAALAVGFAYWLVLIRIENPAERTHLVEYGVVAVLIHMALLERKGQGRPVPLPAVVAVGATALLGLLDEVIQLFLPSRFFDWNDVFFNAFAAFMVIVARLALAPVKRPGWRLWFLWFMAGAIGWGVPTDPSLFGEGRRFELWPSGLSVMIPEYASVALGAIIVGLLHWLILRRYIDKPFYWVGASAAAAAAGGLLALVLTPLNTDLGFVVPTVLFGTVSGVLHWLVLRQQAARAGWWVWASTIGWLVAIPMGDLNGPPGWAAYGAITGAVLVWLLRSR